MKDSKSRFKLKNLIKRLSKYRARHTELISVYVPADYNLNLISQQLEEEYSTSDNIKSKHTRKNVQTALKKMLQQLKLYKKTPKNGLILFAGNVADKPGVQDHKIWAIEPPEPLNVKLYKCDQVFHLDPLREMIEPKKLYGLVVIDKQGAAIGHLKGANVEVVYEDTSIVPGKTRKGGQCLSPETLIRKGNNEIEIEKTCNSIEILGADISGLELKEVRITNKWNTLKKRKYTIITKNPKCMISCSKDHLFFTKDGSINETAAEELEEGDILLAVRNGRIVPSEIKKITKEEGKFKMIDISTDEGNFIANNLVVHNSAQRFARVREGLEKDWYKQVRERVKKEFQNKEVQGIILGGPGPAKEKFKKHLPEPIKEKIIAIESTSYTGEQGLEELVERSQNLLAKERVARERKLAQKFFSVLRKDPQMAVYGKEEVKRALKLGAVDLLLVSEEADEDISEEFIEKVDREGGKWELISSDTRIGDRIENLGSYVAVLRFPIK